MAKKKEQEDTAVVKFCFSKMWASDRGTFLPGTDAELPSDVAESLYLEDMGEILTAEKAPEETD